MINKVCLCNKSNFSLFKTIDSKISSIPEGLDRNHIMNVEIYKCPSCKIIYLKENSSNNSFDKSVSFIQSENKFTYSNKSIYSNNELQFIEILKYKNKSILDFGCGAGYLLNKFKDYTLDIQGIDIDPKSIEYVTKSLKINAKIGDVDSLNKDKQYDLITLFGVFEHLENPTDFIDKIHKIIKKDCNIFLAIPNPKSLNRFLSSFSRHEWDMFLEPGHKYIFNNNNIKIALSNKFEIIKSSTATILIRGKIPFLFNRYNKIEIFISKLCKKFILFRIFYMSLLKFLDLFKLGDISYYLIRKK